MQNIKITFVSLNHNIVNSVNNVFSGYSNITAIHSNIGQCQSHDCIVSPANSFGKMDGGIDRTISYMLNTIDDKDYIGKKVRNIINKRFRGEQPVGSCIILPTDNNKFPYLAHAPTMRIPRNCVGTLNAYYAFKAVLCDVLNFNEHMISINKEPIRTILTTTFCTGCGELSLQMALLQMKKAYDVVRDGVKVSWSNVNKFDQELEKLRKLTIKDDVKNLLSHTNNN